MNKREIFERSIHFINLTVDHYKLTDYDLQNAENFHKYLLRNGIKDSTGYNRNKLGYWDALLSILSILQEEQNKKNAQCRVH